MHRDESYFLKKFAECGKYLAIPPSKLASLKYREIRDYEYYKELLEKLRNVDSLTIKDIGNALNGHAYLLSYGRQKIVLVEHETGLEILYIAGSIASLIGLCSTNQFVDSLPPTPTLFSATHRRRRG